MNNTQYIKIISLLVAILFISCDEEKVFEISTRNKKTLSQLEKFEFFTLDSLDEYSTLMDKIVMAKWLNRDSKYKLAEELYLSIEPQMNLLPYRNTIYQDYILSYINNTVGNKTSSVDYIFSILEELKDENLKDILIFKIRLISILSSMLKSQEEKSFAYSASMYSISLAQKGDVTNDDYASLYLNHSINLLRESEDEVALFYMKKASNYCNDLSNPECKRIKLLELYLEKVDALTKIDSTVLVAMLDTSYYAPRLKRQIFTQLGWMIKDVNLKKEYINEGRKDIDPCQGGFVNMLYIIDDFLAEDNLDSARYFLEHLASECDLSKQKHEYIYLWRMMKYNMKLYSKSNKVIHLYDVLDNAERSHHIRLNTFNKKDGFHFADFIHSNFMDQLEVYNILFQKGKMTQVLNNRMIGCLQNGRSFKKNVNKHSDEMAKNLNDGVYKEYTHLIKQINQLEFSVKGYLDTLVYSARVYEEIFEAHINKYRLSKGFDNIPISEDLVGQDEVMQYLKQHNTQIIEYNISDDYIYITHITKGKLSLVRVNADILDSTKKLVQAIQNKTDVSELSSIIFDVLIKNNIDTSINNVIIISDGQLTQVPFEVLGKNGRYILEDYNVAYNFDIGSIINDRPLQTTNKKAVFSFSSKETINDRSKKETPELIFGLKEAKEINYLYKECDYYEGSNFNEDVLNNMSDYSLLHFSTHSYSDPEVLFGNFMYVENKNGKAKKIFGFDIKGLNINALNVTLSSCESGRGLYKKGAGTVSFSRAFFNAGANSVTKSLWKVNEISTSDLMILYHKNINKGITFSNSLTMAKRKIHSVPKFEHPYYWAGFVLEGNAVIGLKL